jgi:hypothetical protein
MKNMSYFVETAISKVVRNEPICHILVSYLENRILLSIFVFLSENHILV